MDETSTNLWERPRRIWQARGGIRVHKSTKQGSNITIIGALSHGKLFTKLVDGTTTDTIEAFFKAMAEEHNLFGNCIVLDNHTAHRSYAVQDLFEELKCELLFLPPATSILNPIEVLWAHVKRKWRERLLLANQGNVDRDWMVRELHEICNSFSEEELEKLAAAHYRDAIELLNEF